MKRFIPLGIFLLLVIVLGIGLTLNPREVPSPLIDKPAPAFSLARLQAPEQTIGTQDMLGKVWLLNVWASWCTACRAEHPLLVNLARSESVNLIGLNYKDEATDALRWLGQFGNPYQASAFDADGRVGIDWGVYGVPETFVIDKQGIIRYKHIGPVTRESLDEVILPCIQKLEKESSTCI